MSVFAAHSGPDRPGPSISGVSGPSGNAGCGHCISLRCRCRGRAASCDGGRSCCVTGLVYYRADLPEVDAVVPGNGGQGIGQGDLVKQLLDQYRAGAGWGWGVDRFDHMLDGEEAHAPGKPSDLAPGLCCRAEPVGLVERTDRTIISGKIVALPVAMAIQADHMVFRAGDMGLGRIGHGSGCRKRQPQELYCTWTEHLHSKERSKCSPRIIRLDGIFSKAYQPAFGTLDGLIIPHIGIRLAGIRPQDFEMPRWFDY